MRPTEIADYGRGPQLTDCRITVYDVVPYWLAGRPEGYIAWALGIGYEQVVALVEYLYDHRDAVMAVHRKVEERNARGNPGADRIMAATTNPKVLAMRAKVAGWKRQQAEANGDGRPG